MLFAKATLEVTLDKNRISPNETLLMTFRISDNEASSSHPSFPRRGLLVPLTLR